MLDPQTASQSPLSSRIALPIALALAGAFGLAIATLPPLPFSPAENALVHPPAAVSQPAARNVLAETPRPEDSGEVPVVYPEPPSPNELVTFCAKHVTETRSFVVFSRGTCVIINEPCKNPMKEALGILANCSKAEERFLSEPTSEGDLIVSFKDPVFHRFSQTECQKLEPWLDRAATALLSPSETIAAGADWVPPQNARFGLLARRRLLEDATNPVPVRIIRAKERALAFR